MLQRSKQPQPRRLIGHSVGLTFLLALALLVLPQTSTQAQMPPNTPPVIELFQITEIMGGMLVFEGRVSDPPTGAGGYVVRFGGGVSGLSAPCRADGTFCEGFWLPNFTGNVTADVTDPQGAAAETKWFYFQ